MDIEHIIISAMARAFFVSAYADEEEEQGRPIGPRQDWMDHAPETPQSAINHAYRIVGMMEQANSCSLLSMFDAARAADKRDQVPVTEEYATTYGHYLGMEALGHGVGWTDSHADYSINGNKPDIPFTEYMLD